MGTVTSRNFNSPDELRTPPNAAVAVVGLGREKVAQFRMEPGWRWSESVKPIAGTDSCQAAHLGYFVSGRMHVVMDDGSEQDFGPGDFMACPPGHDAWIIGDEPCVVLDWAAYSTYAKR